MLLKCNDYCTSQMLCYAINMNLIFFFNKSFELLIICIHVLWYIIIIKSFDKFCVFILQKCNLETLDNLYLIPISYDIYMEIPCMHFMITFLIIFKYVEQIRSLIRDPTVYKKNCML